MQEVEKELGSKSLDQSDEGLDFAKGRRLEGCQSTNHEVCYGELWECSNCHKIVCYAEGIDDHPELCDDCWCLFFYRGHLDLPGIE